MSMADNLSRADVAELPPEIQSQVIEPWTVGAGSSSFQAQAEPDLAMASREMASLREKTHSLRRSRLAAAALFLAVAFGVVFLFGFFEIGAAVSNWLVRTTVGLRCGIAAVIAGLLLTRITLTGLQTRVLEYVLFGSFTILMVGTQYHLIRDYIHHDDRPRGDQDREGRRRFDDCSHDQLWHDHPE